MDTPIARKRPEPLARALMILIALVLAALGVLAIHEGYVPERSTRHGMTAPLFDAQARWMGLVLIEMAGLPLLLLAPSARVAGWLGSVLVLVLLATVFGGLYLR